MTLGFVEHEKCTCSSPISGFLVHHLLLKQNVGYAKKTWARRPQSEPNPQAFCSPQPAVFTSPQNPSHTTTSEALAKMSRWETNSQPDQVFEHRLTPFNCPADYSESHS